MKRLLLLALLLALAAGGVYGYCLIFLPFRSEYATATSLFWVTYAVLLIGQAHVPVLKRLYPIWLSRFLAAAGYGAIPVFLSRLHDFGHPSQGIMFAASGSLMPMLAFYSVFLCASLICVLIWNASRREKE